MSELLSAQQLINGLASGCMYALIALGYTLIFGSMRLIFFAQGELCMVGAFAALGTALFLADHFASHWPLLLLAALLVAVLVTIGVGLLAERVAIRPIRSAPRTKQLIASLGVSMILQNLVLLKVSAESLPFVPLMPDTPLLVAGVRITPIQLFIICLSLLLMALLQWLLLSSQVGLHIRAVAENPETAQLDGINISRTIMITFIIGSMLAAFAGVMMGSYDGVVKYNMGFLPGIKGFTAAILGGFGHPAGAMLGGLVLGLAETFAAGYISSTYKDVIAFALLILVIIFRPSGLIRRATVTA